MRATRLFLRAILSVALVCFVWLSAVPTRADQVLPPAWNVTGALLIVGNDVCSGLPCTETVSFSFEFGYEILTDLGNNYYPYVTDFLATGFGALGSFSYTSAFEFFNAEMSDLAIDAAGREIDLHLVPYTTLNPPASGLVFPAPVTPTFVNFASLYDCEGISCVDFSDNANGPTFQFGGVGSGGPVVYRVTPIVPEPATLSLLACGLFGVGLAGAMRWKLLRPNPTPA